MQLSDDFKLKEFERSSTADRKGIDNSIPEDKLDNLKYLVSASLQPLHDMVGKIVSEEYYIRITSGYRCPELNQAIGGSTASFHMQAMAADCELWIRQNGQWVEHNGFLYHLTKMQGLYTELIWEYGSDSPITTAAPAWVHIAIARGDNRQMLKHIN